MIVNCFMYSWLNVIKRASIAGLQGLMMLIGVLCPTLSQAQVKIMPVGDSITHGDKVLNSYRRALWQKLLAGMYTVDFVGGQHSNYDGLPPNPDFDLDHHGHGGWRTYEILPEIRQWTLDCKPDIILLHVGTNDLVDERTVESTRDNISAIIDQIRLANPAMKILLAQLIPSSWSVRLNNDISSLNALLPTLVAEKNTNASPVAVVDQNTGFNIEAGGDLYDQLHPNASGEEKMAERWYQSLRSKSMLGRPLPVTLVQFSAQVSPAGVRLQWTTASEQNNAGFTVERSTTGVDFEAIGQVVGQGTSNNRHTYSFLDIASSQSVLYYRLRQTDIDGTVVFSAAVTVNGSRSVGVEVSPVPATDVINVRGLPSTTTVIIRNVRGQTVYQQLAQSPQMTIDISHLAGGVYFLQAGSQSTRFIKQ